VTTAEYELGKQYTNAAGMKMKPKALTEIIKKLKR